MPSGLKRVFITPLTTNDASDKEGVGTLRFEGNKVYKYIQYDNGAAVAAVAGQVAYYVAATGYAANQVTSDLSGSDEVGAGVLQAALTDQYYGWIQIKGVATLSIALTAGVDGDSLTPTGSTDGTLDSAVDTTASNPVNICAYAGDASANIIMCDFLF